MTIGPDNFRGWKDMTNSGAQRLRGVEGPLKAALKRSRTLTVQLSLDPRASSSPGPTSVKERS